MLNQLLSPLRGSYDCLGLAGDARILRDRMARDEVTLNRQTAQPQLFSSARLIVQVFDNGSMGTAPDLYYFTHPVLVTGMETEGSAATLTVDTATTVPVVVLQNAPSVGDYLTAYSVGGRWVAERGVGWDKEAYRASRA